MKVEGGTFGEEEEDEWAEEGQQEEVIWAHDVLV